MELLKPCVVQGVQSLKLGVPIVAEELFWQARESDYGVALVEALVIAKVVLIGRVFGFSRRFEDRALIVPVMYKSILFGLLVMLFGVVEHLVSGWIHKQGLLSGLHKIAEVGLTELAARSLTLIIAFVPFFAFWEIGRVLGMKKLAAMFFSKPDSPLAPGHGAS